MMQVKNCDLLSEKQSYSQGQGSNRKFQCIKCVNLNSYDVKVTGRTENVFAISYPFLEMPRSASEYTLNPNYER